MSLSKTMFDAVILGAGVAGLGTARALAKLKLKVLVVERDRPGAASARAAGILDPFLEITSPDHPVLPLNLEAFQDMKKLLPQIRDESGLNPGYAKKGLLYLAYDRHEESELQRRYAWQQKLMRVRHLRANEIFNLEPHAGSGAACGLFYPEIGRITPRLFLAALKRACVNRGVQFIKATHRSEFILRAGRGHECRIDHRVISTRFAINARGAWAGDRYVEPIRGQIMIGRAEQIPEHILHTLSNGYIVPWDNGYYLAGSTLEKVGYRPSLTMRGKARIVSEVRKLYPRLAVSMKPVECWAGLRPKSRDEMPIIGPTRIKDYYVLTGLYRGGMLCGNTAGKLLAKAMVEDKMPLLIKPFSPMRFERS